MRFGTLRHPFIAHRRTTVMPRWVRRADRSANRRVNARHDVRARDSAYRRLSHAADHGRLWFVLAGVLVVSGRSRAALRGVASLTVASIIANLIGKKVFGGSRPILKDIPVGRRLAAYPTSASFPSGHSASAAAFATGVAVEAPVAGAVVAPLAAAVGYSRMHVGAHWLSDVVGGFAIGAGVALLGRVLLPARPSVEGPAPERGERIDLPSSPDGSGALIFVNPSSGVEVIRTDPRSEIEKELPGARLSELDSDDPPSAVVARALVSTSPPRVLGVCGGDGTVSALAAVAREAGLPLLVLPGGTFNHFARAIGADTVEHGIEALRDGRGMRVAVAELSTGGPPVTVLNAGSVGIYPDFVARREGYRDRLGKWLGGVVAAWGVLREAEPIEIELDGESMRVWSVFASVGRNDPQRVATMRRWSVDDDVLDVRVLHARGPRYRAVASLAFGRRTAAVARALHLMPRSSDIERRLVPELTLAVLPQDGSVPVFVHDGELETRLDEDAAGRHEIRFTMVPSDLRVYA
ncbi:bifunctional phosphatase PAP2/diacylglycerol kinase family protein [Microbacterium sp.]|jgi:membrane-associated phospholipid phosphatase/diacylglycerol kinase family enzyme|uniref:bifunctional phosphatase PAP2/diacylglycerol kinase family protein n=1 Tax=Microbacterium sp. TaxID=51671 RepID=UPI0037C82AC3